MARGSLLRTRARGFVMLAAVLALGSCSVQSQGIGETVAMIPGYAGGGAAPSGPPIQGYDAPIPVIQVGLSETDATHMAIDLSQPFAPQGKVSFLVTNNGAKKHEFVVLATDTAAASFPIVSFEGEANRIDEDAKGVTNVGETGDMEPGAVMMLTLDLAPGHYAVVCNLPGHYAMGMHQDFFVTPTASTPVSVGLSETDATHMAIDLSQPFAPQGKVSFLVTNNGAKKHEFVVLATDTAAASFPIVSFEGEANRIDEDAKGVTNVGETGDMEPGAVMMLTLDLAPGHYAVVCNLPGHYAMGMHQDFFVTPTASTPVSVGLSETDATHMAIDLSQPFAPQGKVSFLVTNNGAKKHEFVVLATDTAAASFPIVSFEGEANRIDEDAKGVTNVGETGDMEPGAVMMLTLDLAPGHYAVVCNLPGHYAMGMHQDFFVTPTASTPVSVGLSETDATHMAIDLSQPFAPQGKVSFLVTNNGAKKHEFVVLATDTAAASFPIVSFEGEANRIDEDAKGVTNVGETGDMEPGAVMMLTLDLAPGHYAVVCNLPGHYAMGMHQDFFVTPTASTPVSVGLSETDATHMAIDLSQPFAPQGKVSFLVTNNGAKKHEFVVLATDTAAASFPIVSFEGEANRIDEDAKGVTNVGETGDMEPGAVMMLTLDLAPGHYAVVCNLPGHYAMGMHQDFFVTPQAA